MFTNYHRSKKSFEFNPSALDTLEFHCDLAAHGNMKMGFHQKVATNINLDHHSQ